MGALFSTRSTAILALTALPLLLGACEPPPYRTELPIPTATWRHERLELEYADGALLPSTETLAILEEIVAVKPEAEFLIGVRARSDTAVDEEFAEARRNALHQLLLSKNLDSSILTPDATKARVAFEEDGVILAGQYESDVPECPDWSKPSARGFHNRPSSNWGCSAVRNLALMVANPRDLVTPASLASRQTYRISIRIKEFREGELYPFPDDIITTGQNE